MTTERLKFPLSKLTQSGATTSQVAQWNGTAWVPATVSTDLSGYVTLVGIETLTNKSLNSPTLVTPALGTPSSGTLTNCTGLPISTGVSGLGTNVALALAITASGSGGMARTTSAVFTTPNLGTPSAIVLTNASGTASININGTVGATTPNTVACTTLVASVQLQTASNGTAAAPSLIVGSASNFGFYSDSAGGRLYVAIGGNARIGYAGTTMAFGSDQIIGWSGTSGGPFSSALNTTVSRNANGVLQIGTTANNALGSLLLTNLTSSGTITLGTYTVSTLPSASANTRAIAFVTDCNLAFNSTNLGSTATAGGAILVPVFSNGTNWVIG